MFITRATRHDQGDREAFFESDGWGDPPKKGTAFIARDGRIVGNLTLIEVAPQTVIVEDVLVAETHRKKGIGRQLMHAAMNSRGGKLYLCCHPERLQFYGHFGFTEVPFDELPEPVKEFFIDDGAAPHQIAEGHVHHFLTAR